MSLWMEGVKKVIRVALLRKQFPRSVIHWGAAANKKSVLGDYCVLFSNANLVDTNLGAYSYVQSGSFICNAEIGPFCSIAGGVNIGLAAHPTSMVSTNPVFYDSKQPLPKFFTKERVFTQNMPRTTIGADVWIGQGVMIKAGITIGTGSVIGAGAVVTKDISPYSIAVGNPCRPIRKRFSEDVCQRLLESRWWEFDDSRLEQLAPLFADPESLLDKLDSTK